MNSKRHLLGSLAEKAYIQLREKILKGELPLGSALSRRGLAADFGMSFVPISAAVKRLEEQGLVESHPRVGTRIRVPTAQDIRDQYVIREALEVQSARLFAEKASADERLELRSMAAKLDALADRCAAAENDPNSAFHAQMYHLSFHTRIAECTGCRALCGGLEQNQVLIFNWLYDIAARHRMPPFWHKVLIDALAETDSDAAEAAMRRHVRHGLDEIQTEIADIYGVNKAYVRGTEPSDSPTKSGAWRRRVTTRR